MIEVQKLSKTFAGVYAIQKLSFQIQKGEIVGFLGQNGAGKSTTLRILTGYLPPSEGGAKIDGLDIETFSQKTREKIGYLPESVPLYPELRVREFLRFRAGLKDLRQPNKEIDQVIEKTALKEHEEQIIGTLSKGYRQRVGLADALLGRPPILLLDEPTEGLDPTQIGATRHLLKDLASEHTVLLSTHLLPEVERLCARVLLLHKGKLVADIARNKEGGWGAPPKPALVVSFSSPPKEIVKKLSGLSGVSSVAPKEEDSFELVLEEGREVQDELIALCASQGLKLRSMALKEKRTLEEVFMMHTTQEAS